MNKHTPAPWTATLWGNEEFAGWQFSAGGSLLPLDDATGDPEEAEANATLIAFAPEMLQELERIINRERHRGTILLDIEDLLALENVVAKAKGARP